MTTQQLTAIRERAEKATAGPWEADNWGTTVKETVQNDGQIICVATTSNRDFDSTFIARARTDIPDLLAYVVELEGALEAGQRNCDQEYANQAAEKILLRKRVAELEAIAFAIPRSK